MTPLLARRPTISTVRKLTRASLIALVAIVGTGGAVRLTRSGLGCDAWPHCGNRDGWHAYVEYGNRLASGVVGLIALAAIVAALRVSPPRRDLRPAAFLLGGGFLAQAGLGALSVKLHLSPGMVMAHFLLSMVLIALAAVLYVQADPQPPPAAVLRPELRALSWAILAATAVVVVLGTLTTGSGPHSGANPDAPAARFTFLSLQTITTIHGNTAMLIVALAVANVLVLRISDAPAQLVRSASYIAGAVAVQAVIGVTQYALDLPPLLVGLHLVGAAVLWLAAVNHHLTVRRVTTPVQTRTEASV